MSVLVTKDTKLAVAGITGREGSFHTLNNRKYGTNVVGGVNPKKAGENVEGIPVFADWETTVKESGANTAMIFVPPPFAADAIMEAADAGVKLAATSNTLPEQLGDVLGVPTLVLSGFVRVVTHPRVFVDPTPLANALEFVTALRASPAHVAVEPGRHHWDLFARLCSLSGARGNVVPDAYLAALAGTTFVSIFSGRVRDMGYDVETDDRTSGPITAIYFDREHGTLWGGASDFGEDSGIAW